MRMSYVRSKTGRHPSSTDYQQIARTQDNAPEKDTNAVRNVQFMTAWQQIEAREGRSSPARIPTSEQTKEAIRDQQRAETRDAGREANMARNAERATAPVQTRQQAAPAQVDTSYNAREADAAANRSARSMGGQLMPTPFGTVTTRPAMQRHGTETPSTQRQGINETMGQPGWVSVPSGATAKGQPEHQKDGKNPWDQINALGRSGRVRVTEAATTPGIEHEQATNIKRDRGRDR